MSTSVRTLTYDNWAEFKSDFCHDLFGRTGFLPGTCLFRGQRRGSWPLASSFDRWFAKSGIEQARGEVAAQTISIFKNELLMSGADEVKLGTSDSNDIELMALAQHHGFPTRLLDWTESPYIAAFFAFDLMSNDRDFPEEVAVWALHLDSGVWEPDLGVEVVYLSGQSNFRMKNQRGSFTVSRTPYSSLEEHVDQCKPSKTALTRMLIPGTELRAATRDLAAMGISPARLFPGVDGVARSSLMQAMAMLGLD